MENKMKRILSVLIIGLLICFGGIHVYINRTLESTFLKFVEKQSQSGIKITYDSYSTNFKFLGANLSIQNPIVQASEDWIEQAKTEGDLVISVSLFSPRTITFSSKGKSYLVWKSPDSSNPYSVQFNHFEGLTSLTAQDTLAKTLFTYDSADLLHKDNDKPIITSLDGRLEFEKDHQNKEFIFAINSNALFIDETIKAPFGNNIENLSFRGKTTKLGQGSQFKEVLTKWYNDSGTIEIEALDIKWGSLDLKTSGTVMVDELMQPIIALTATIQDMKSVLNTLVHQKIISKKSLTLVNLAIGALSQKKDGEDHHKFSLTLQGGELSVGPIPLLQGLKIKW